MRPFSERYADGMDSAAPHVVGRVAALLRGLSRSPRDGSTTSELARSAGLPRPTTHRLLMSLAEAGFADREQRSGRWFLGPELYLLGTAAAGRYDVTEQARPHVHRLATETGESAFFSARRGDETVCLLRTDGSFPIRSFVLYEGARFPLGVVSAGLAVLSFLDDHELNAYLGRVDLTGDWGESHAEPALRSRIAATRELGYAVNPGLVVEGSWGMAAAVFDRLGNPSWALTITGVESRFRADRRPMLGKLLLDEAHRLTLALSRDATAHR